MGELIQLSRNDKPLCPNVSGIGPINPQHELHNRLVDVLTETAEKDSDGELAPPADALYVAVAYGRVSDRMDLYRHSAATAGAAGFVKVEAWWWQCCVCGLVLPAQRWINHA